MVPYPRLHFFICSIAPSLNKGTQSIHKNLSAVELEGQVYNARNVLCESDFVGRFLTNYIIFRGNLNPKACNEAVLNVANKNSSYFVEWIPNNEMVSSDISLRGLLSCASLIGNNTSIQYKFKDILLKFKKLFKNKSFIHWYTQEGLDETEFVESEQNINDLIDEYQLYQDATAEDDEFSDEEYDDDYLDAISESA